jgi:hypothetical protein
VVRLGLVPAQRHRHGAQGAGAHQAHPVLRVAQAAAHRQAQRAARRPVGQPAQPGHVARPAAISDDDVRVLRRGDEARDQLRRVLAVGVQDHDGVRAERERRVDAGGHRGALAVVAAERHDAQARAAGRGRRR